MTPCPHIGPYVISCVECCKANEDQRKTAKPHKKPCICDTCKKAQVEAREMGKKETIAEFVSGRRCFMCGNIKEANLTDSCYECLEEV